MIERYSMTSAKSYDSEGSNTENSLNEESSQRETTSSSREYFIDGDGFHRKMLPLHLGHTILLWFVLKFTFMSKFDFSEISAGMWITSIIICFSISMISFYSITESVARYSQMAQIIRNECSNNEWKMSQKEASAELLEIMKNNHHTINYKGIRRLLILNPAEKKKNFILTIQEV